MMEAVLSGRGWIRRTLDDRRFWTAVGVFAGQRVEVADQRMNEGVGRLLCFETVISHNTVAGWMNYEVAMILRLGFWTIMRFGGKTLILAKKYKLRLFLIN